MDDSCNLGVYDVTVSLGSTSVQVVMNVSVAMQLQECSAAKSSRFAFVHSGPLHIDCKLEYWPEKLVSHCLLLLLLLLLLVKVDH